ncbi:HipA domain-containing protein [Vibrio sp. 10N]|uniref:HipA domain-containing protein n=1 Tax=Vibrio sp. 10N TaxID=3058938 RepID=UPI0028143EAC|nr:hypothetical protein VB10N_03500 [Vibrio sp. 10N]
MKTIDVTEWNQDERSGIFPIGARDKQMLWAPEGVPAPLRPHWPYLFKESIRAYPDQFWTEIIAFIISKHLGVDVPAAYPGVKEIDGELVGGALIEWMYEPEVCSLVHAGDFLKQTIPDFDTDSGKQHNLKDMLFLLRVFSARTELVSDIHNWLADMALFDALIGNTDRHQENWGLIFELDFETKESKVTLSPLYDNGTSLGHERFLDKIAGWNDEALLRYINKGMHHLRFTKDDTKKRIPLIELVTIVARREPSKQRMNLKLDGLDLECMLSEIEQLTKVDNVTPLSKERFDWIERIVRTRYKLIKEAITT